VVLHRKHAPVQAAPPRTTYNACIHLGTLPRTRVASAFVQASTWLWPTDPTAIWPAQAAMLQERTTSVRRTACVDTSCWLSTLKTGHVLFLVRTGFKRLSLRLARWTTRAGAPGLCLWTAWRATRMAVWADFCYRTTSVNRHPHARPLTSICRGVAALPIARTDILE